MSDITLIIKGDAETVRDVLRDARLRSETETYTESLHLEDEAMSDVGRAICNRCGRAVAVRGDLWTCPGCGTAWIGIGPDKAPVADLEPWTVEADDPKDTRIAFAIDGIAYRLSRDEARRLGESLVGICDLLDTED